MVDICSALYVSVASLKLVSVVTVEGTSSSTLAHVDDDDFESDDEVRPQKCGKRKPVNTVTSKQ